MAKPAFCVYTMRTITPEQRKIKRKLSDVYSELTKELRRDVCSGCKNVKKAGRTTFPNSWSHIVSRGEARKIGKLFIITAKDNIVRDCQGDDRSCHSIWEYNGTKNLDDKMELLNFEYRMIILHKYCGPEPRSLFRTFMVALETEDKDLFEKLADRLEFSW